MNAAPYNNALGQETGGVVFFRFRIDFSQPLYEQILDQMRSSIAKGEIGLGEKMPSVRELAQELRMNPNTVMRAYQELERDGLTEKRRGLPSVFSNRTGREIDRNDNIDGNRESGRRLGPIVRTRNHGEPRCGLVVAVVRLPGFMRTASN